MRMQLMESLEKKGYTVGHKRVHLSNGDVLEVRTEPVKTLLGKREDRVHVQHFAAGTEELLNDYGHLPYDFDTVLNFITTNFAPAGTAAE